MPRRKKPTFIPAATPPLVPIKKKRLIKPTIGNASCIQDFRVQQNSTRWEEPDDKAYDVNVAEENGTPTNFMLPVRQMGRVSYSKEMAARGCRAVFKKYIDSLPLDDLKFALARNDTQKAVSFLASLIDPSNSKFDIVDLALFHGITLNDMMSIWRNDCLLQSMNNLFNSLPPLTLEAVQDATSVKTCCPRCEGAGTVIVERPAGEEWITCPSCDGAGTIRKAGNLKAREQIFKSTGIVRGEPGMTVNITSADSHVDSVLDELERLSNPAIPILDGTLDSS